MSLLESVLALDLVKESILELLVEEEEPFLAPDDSSYKSDFAGPYGNFDWGNLRDGVFIINY